MQKWEYDTFDLPADSEGIYALLNDLANEGWELVAVDNKVGYFKRPFNVKQEFKGAQALVRSDGKVDYLISTNGEESE